MNFHLLSNSIFSDSPISPMAFHPRNLLNDSLVDLQSLYCKPFCDLVGNPSGLCPLECFSLCTFCCKTVLLSPPPPWTADISTYDGLRPKDHHHKLSIFLTVSLVVLATAFFVFSCYTVYRLYSNRSRRRLSDHRMPEDEESGRRDDFLDLDQVPVVDHHIWHIRTVGLEPAVISSISVVKYKKGEGLVEGSDCCVCLSEFEEDENLKLLPKCNHAFHIPCIDTWLRSHTNCPVCRAGIVKSAATFPPPQDLVVQNSILTEETDRDIALSEIECVAERTAGDYQGLSRNSDSNLSSARIGLKMGEFVREERDLGQDRGIQAMRRSVSMDFLSASVISGAIANASTTSQFADHARVMIEQKESSVSKKIDTVGNPSTVRCLKTGPSSMKRSVSCSAKSFLSIYGGRCRSSISGR